MKRYNNLYNDILRLDSILTIYEKEVKPHTKNKKQIEEFDSYLMLNITKILMELSSENIIFDKYNIFLICENKYRIIMAQSIHDKLINHLVARFILLKCFDNTLIDSNVATSVNKGTSYEVKLLKKYINEIKKKSNNIYYLKCDITKYFYSINHNILKTIVRKKIKDNRVLRIIDKIIDTSNYEYINNEIKQICEKEKERIMKLNINNLVKQNKINELENIIKYIYGNIGIPIGNMTSQVFAIIYLSDLDHYIKEELGIKYYIRYMDDFVLLNADKQSLKIIKNKIEEKVINDFNLVLNKKTHIGMLKNGLDFLGFRFILNDNKLYLKIRNTTKKRFKQKIKYMRVNKKLDSPKAHNIISSYYGILKHGNGYNLYNNIIK